MNISMMQALSGVNMTNSPLGKMSQTNSNHTFGSVFNGLETAAPGDLASLSDNGGQESLLSLLNTDSMDELLQIYHQITGVSPIETALETDMELIGSLSSLEEMLSVWKEDTALVNYLGEFSFSNSTGIAEISAMFGIPKEQLLQSLQSIIGESANGMSIEDLLSKMGTLQPPVFSRLTDALEGDKVQVKQQAVEVTAFLKAVVLLAPKTDMSASQELQVLNVQQQLMGMKERLGSALQSSSKTNIIDVMNAKSSYRLVVQTDDTRNKDNQNQDNSSKETTHKAGNVLQTNITNRVEFMLTETIKTANRSETRMKEMQAIMNRASFGQTGGTNRILIKLYPEHLGQVRIELLETNGILTARILASTALGKEMLDSQQAQLRQAFAQQNLQVERIDISQSLQETNKGERDQNAFTGQFKQEQQQDDNEQQSSGEEEMTFQEFMIELEA